MTSDNRLFISLDEIIGVQYKCKKCGATIIIPRDQWDYPPQQCPANCTKDPARPAVWLRADSMEADALRRLQKDIALLSSLRGVECTISLEIKTESEKRGTGNG